MGQDYSTVPTLKDLEGTFANVLSVVLSLAGIVLFIMLIVGGFKYITSGGDPKQTEEAKHGLTSAITGFVLLALSFLLLKLIEKITGVTLTTFSIIGK